ncbi:MAG: alpha-glucosidase [Planctomycetes bacterium]|nr:alpha-glucosidase [Planctomycetota bacterium]
MKKRIVLIGAGSAQFGLCTLADILQSRALEGSTIVLHDINPKTLKMVETVATKAVEEQNLRYSIEATASREEAFRKADFCVISIEAGDRFKLWEQDWKIPLKFGNKQIFGENGGPGGLFHSLRIIPPILEICGDINKICPDAFVINFSNPMSRICLAIKRKYPDLKTIGLCHEIGSMEKHLPKILKTSFSNLEIKAGGLNHFSILLEARYKNTGRDAYPEIRKRARDYFGKMHERSLVNEIFTQYGYLPITTDSHFGEYIQWAWEIADNKGIRDFFNFYKKYCAKRTQRFQKLFDGKNEDEWWKESSGERVIPIIEGIVTDSRQYELAVNIPNDGLIDNLPGDLVVEVPAIIGKNGAQGVKLGMMPKGIASLLNNQAAVQDLTAEAAINGSKRTALHALLADPQVTSYKNAAKILDKIIGIQNRFLGYLK